MNTRTKIAETKRRPIRAANLRRIRLARGMTGEAMAAECGIAVSFIREMETGLRSISIRTIDRIADGLKLEPAAVLSELDRRIGR
jgi:transcriptional regulator with XRE-family HTH domain